MKIDVHASKRISTRLASVDYVIRDSHTKIMMVKENPIVNCPILVA